MEIGILFESVEDIYTRALLRSTFSNLSKHARATCLFDFVDQDRVYLRINN